MAPDVDVEALLMLLCQITGIHMARRSVLGLYVVTSKSNALAPMTLLPDKDFFIGMSLLSIHVCIVCVTKYL